MSKDINFSELMSAKFCHDLSGPIGAISNSIDFLDSNNVEMRKKAIELVQFSSKQAVNKIMFFRQAYGIFPLNAESSLFATKDLIDKFAEDSKLIVNFMTEGKDAIIEGSFSKILLNMAAILSAIMMSNGTLDIKVDKKNMKFIGAASSYNLDESLIAILKGNIDDEVTTRNIQYFYTYYIAKDAGYTIDMSKDSDKVVFNLVKKD